MVAGLLALAEVAVFALVAAQIGLGWAILATLATSVLGWALLARQGLRAVTELRERARTRQPAGRELGDAGLIAVGGLLMLVPGFLTDLVGLLCLLPGTRGVVRAALVRLLFARLPDRMRGPVRVTSNRAPGVDADDAWRSPRSTPLVIEGEVVRDPEPPAWPAN
jgi:UPF0716 protein FxsA